MGNSLSKDRVQLLGDIVLLVFDVCLPQLDGNIRVSFPVDVSWVEVCGLEWRNVKSAPSILMNNSAMFLS